MRLRGSSPRGAIPLSETKQSNQEPQPRAQHRRPSLAKKARAAVLYAIFLARTAAIEAFRDFTEPSLLQEITELTQEVALLRAEIEIKDARIAQIPPRRRPRYPPTIRYKILELRTARGWSAAEAGRRMFITPATLVGWMTRVDEAGVDALVQLASPVNRFPDLVAYVVQRLKVHLPALGKVAIAQHLARAGLHLSPSTVHRMLRRSSPPPAHSVEVPEPAPRCVLTPVIAKRPHHVWQMDFTVWPLFGGLWKPWPPFFSWAWPFAVWVAVIIDQHSRHVVGVEVMRRPPRGEDALRALERAIEQFEPPKYLIVDLGTHFQNGTFLEGCARHGISVRCASRDSLRATAHVERFIRTLKAELPWRRATSSRRASPRGSSSTSCGTTPTARTKASMGARQTRSSTRSARPTSGRGMNRDRVGRQERAAPTHRHRLGGRRQGGWPSSWTATRSTCRSFDLSGRRRERFELAISKRATPRRRGGLLMAREVAPKSRIVIPWARSGGRSSQALSAEFGPKHRLKPLHRIR